MSDDERILRLLGALAPFHDCRVWTFYKAPGTGVGFALKGVEWKEGCMLVGKFGTGATVSEAIADYWRQATEGCPTLVVSAGTTRRREASWNGLAWEFSEVDGE